MFKFSFSKRLEKRLMEMQDQMDTERRSRLSTGLLSNTSFIGPTTSMLNRSFQPRLNTTYANNDRYMRRTSPEPNTTSGIYSQMMNAVDRAKIEPVNRSSPLQRI